MAEKEVGTVVEHTQFPSTNLESRLHIIHFLNLNHGYDVSIP
jgi:hypothetical protein